MIFADGWTQVIFSDGNEQYYQGPVAQHQLFIERVAGPKSRRKRWAIVDRTYPHNSVLYPPKICGPFPNLESAKAAYLVIIHSR